MRRRHLFTFVIVTFLVATIVAVTAPEVPAHTQRPAEKRISFLINRARINHNRVKLVHGTRLHRAARRQVERMIDRRQVFHGPRPLFCTTGWGEIVAAGLTPEGVFRQFMRSDAHRAVLLHRSWRRFGVGARRAAGLLWVSVEFCGPL